MTVPLVIPRYEIDVIDKNGKMDRNWYKYLALLGKSAGASPTFSDDIQIRDILGALTPPPTQQQLGQTFYPQTDAERTAGVGPVNYAYPPGNVLRYGADPTGVRDSTATILVAFNVALASGDGPYFPAGTYSADTLQLPLLSYSNPFWINGAGYGVTKIQKRSADGLPLFITGSASATAFSTELRVYGLTFSGIAGNTPAAVQSYDLVRSVFDGCIFQNSIAGMVSSGGISNTYQDCIFQNNQIGAKFVSFTSLAGGGYPNNIELQNCGVFGNTLQGVYFNGGRNLNIDACDIEGNGTSGNSATMGVYVANVNAESGGAAPAIGVSIFDCWIEANAGDAALQFNNGVNTVRSSYLAANANATNDIHIIGGNYHLSELAFGTNKTANILEDAGVNAGNSIVNCFDALVGSFTFNVAKTMVVGAWNDGTGTLTDTILMRSGSVPVVQTGGVSMNTPLIQTGSTTTSTGGSIAVTFPTAYPLGVTPVILPTVIDAPSITRLIGVQISNVSNTGFTASCNSLLSGSTTVAGLVGETITWISIGSTT
jgi:hypothetical protein